MNLQLFLKRVKKRCPPKLVNHRVNIFFCKSIFSSNQLLLRGSKIFLQAFNKLYAHKLFIISIRMKFHSSTVDLNLIRPQTAPYRGRALILGRNVAPLWRHPQDCEQQSSVSVLCSQKLFSGCNEEKKPSVFVLLVLTAALFVFLAPGGWCWSAILCQKELMQRCSFNNSLMLVSTSFYHLSYPQNPSVESNRYE